VKSRTKAGQWSTVTKSVNSLAQLVLVLVKFLRALLER